MSLQSDLIARIQDLNTPAQQRVYDNQVPQGAALPLIAMTEISGTQPTMLSGAPLFARATIRLAIFTRTAIERDAIAVAIREDLRRFRGLLGATQVSSIRIETSTDEVALADGDNVIKGKGLDLFVVYR